MKIKRLTWMKIHGYISCFFLPTAILYVISGTLYMFDIHGGMDETTYELENVTVWPETEQAATKAILPIIERHNLPPLPDDDYYIEEGIHTWWSLHHAYSLERRENTGDITPLYLSYRDYGIWYKIVMIHKGKAGLILVAFGVLLGVSLTISLLSGLVIVLSTPHMRKVALQAMACGAVTMTTLYFLS